MHTASRVHQVANLTYDSLKASAYRDFKCFLRNQCPAMPLKRELRHYGKVEQVQDCNVERSHGK